MSILRHIVGIASELLTLKDPYDKYVEVKVLGVRQEPNVHMDGSPAAGCRDVITVQANNYHEVSKLTEGWTPQGNRTVVHTHVGRNRWEISTEEWDTQPHDGRRGWDDE